MLIFIIKLIVKRKNFQKLLKIVLTKIERYVIICIEIGVTWGSILNLGKHKCCTFGMALIFIVKNGGAWNESLYILEMQ